MPRLNISTLFTLSLFVLFFSFCTPVPSKHHTSYCNTYHSDCVPFISSIQGPLLKDVLADPSVLRVNNTYYAYGTQHKQARINVPYAISKHGLQGRWKAANKDAMPRNETGLGKWTLRPHGDSGLWNPDVSKLVSC